MSTKDDALLWKMADTRLDHSSLGEIEAMRRVLAVARKAILEEAAALLHETRGNILLHCGEMTAQELRSVEAVLRWKQDAIRSLNGAKP